MRVLLISFMSDTYLYTLVSVIIVSLVSLIGVFTLGMKDAFLKSMLHYLISFAAGALLGDVFIHVIPEISQQGFSPRVGIYFLIGIVIFFLLEKTIVWYHTHDDEDSEHHDDHANPSFVYVSIIGDSLHNFIDGLVIAASFLVSIPLGIAATIAVIFHEIPHEIGHFAILIHGGWSKGKAMLYNFGSALTSVLGAVIVLLFAKEIQAPQLLLSLAGASFIYLAMSDIIPELHKEKSVVKSFWQIVSFIIGVGVMALLISLE